jgi:hypothetical protein
MEPSGARGTNRLVLGLAFAFLLLDLAPVPHPLATLATAGTGRALISIELNGETFVPGNVFSLHYRTKPLTLQGAADFYFAVQFPNGQLLFVNEGGGFVTAFEPFRRTVTVVEETRPLVSLLIPIDLPFGTYTLFMGMAYAGVTPDPGNLQPALASNISQTTVAYAPLSPEQQAVLQARANPDILSVLYVEELNQKQESWLYLSPAPPTRFRFLNGALQGQDTVSGATGGPGPKLDPSRFTPQTTLGQLTAAFGQQASTEPFAGGFQVVRYALGLDVVLRNGRLSSANTRIP